MVQDRAKSLSWVLAQPSLVIQAQCNWAHISDAISTSWL